MEIKPKSTASFTLEVNGRGWRKIAFFWIWTLCTFTVFIIFINSLNHQLVKETVYIKDNFSTFKCKQHLISHLLNCRNTPSWLRAITPCLYLLSKKIKVVRLLRCLDRQSIWSSSSYNDSSVVFHIMTKGSFHVRTLYDWLFTDASSGTGHCLIFGMMHFVAGARKHFTSLISLRLDLENSDPKEKCHMLPSI